MLIPRAKPYPTLLDYASKDLLESGGEFTTNYRAFHAYVVSYEDGTVPGKAYLCVFLPRCYGQGETAIPVDISKRPDEALESAPKSEAGGHRRIGMLVEAPNTQHWGKRVRTSKGPEPYLGKELEDRLAAWLIKMARIGFGQTKEQLFGKAKQLVTQLGITTPFPNGRPMDNWYRSFMNRYPELSERQPMIPSKQ